LRISPILLIVLSSSFILPTMSFSAPPNPKAYNDRVYEVCRAIPSGRVMTYGRIAQLIPPPAGVAPDTYLKLSPRWVGSAMAACPDDVPWQRVINGQGKVSQRPGMGVLVQRKLLEQEGVTFDARDRVDLETYGWQPEPAWLRARGLVVWVEGGDASQPSLF
jgi:methylated-DNA-protein-cysteine methyltransferase related protein